MPISLFVPPADGVTNPRPSGSHSHGPAAQHLSTARRGAGRARAGLEHAPPSSPAPPARMLLAGSRGTPYLRRLLIGSRGAARALSDRSAAWAGKGLPSHLPSEWRRKATSVRERPRKRVPAIPEQASASRKRPEEEEEEEADRAQSDKSGPARLALRMRRGLGARANQTCALG